MRLSIQKRIIFLSLALGVLWLSTASSVAGPRPIAAPEGRTLQDGGRSGTPQPIYRLKRPQTEKGQDASGDGQLGIVGTELSRPLSVVVLDAQQRPVRGVRVFFSFASIPKGSEGQDLGAGPIVTNGAGQASVRLRLGRHAGKYSVTASIAEDLEHSLTLSVDAMKPTWMLFLAFALVGGLALFLFGMDMMSSGLKRAAGNKLKSIISALTNNRILGLFVGIFVTAVVQSSSATTVILVSFVQARLMTLAQSMGIILGADVGTTFTVQLISFKIADYALLMIGAGFVTSALSPREGWKFTGQALLGAGLIFFGMDIMSQAMYPLRGYPPFIELLLHLENPVVGILVGTLFTAVIQSSGAFAGILLALAQQGVLSLEAAVPPLLGANIGTCVTAVLASLRTSREAKRVAAAHTLFKILGVLLLVGFIPPFIELVRAFTPVPPGLNSADPEVMARTIPRQLANAHTIFNVGLALLFLPLTGYLARLVERMIPDEPYRAAPVETGRRAKYLDPNLVSTPVFALHGAALEILRLCRKVEAMYQRVFVAIRQDNLTELEAIEAEGERIGSIYSELLDYLKRLNSETMRTSRALTSIKFGMIGNDLANITRTITNSIVPNVRLKIQGGEDFSPAGKQELFEYGDLVGEHFSLVVEAFEKRDTKAADRALELDKRIGVMENVNRFNHVQRLAEGGEKSVRTSEYHLNILEALRRISAHLKSMSVQIQVAESRGGKPAREAE